MENYIQPEYSSFPLDSELYMELGMYSSIEEIEKDIKDAICCCVSNNLNGDLIIQKVVEK